MIQSTLKLNRHTIVTAAVWAVSALVLGSGSLLFYWPQKARLQHLKAQCSESQIKLDQAKLASKETVRTQQQQRSETASGLLSNFSTQQDTITELVFGIGRIATNDLRLKEFSSKNQQQNGHSTVGKSELISEVWLNVDFNSSFEQFARFINHLESHRPAVFIEEISFQRASQNSYGHAVSLQLSFLTKTENQNKSVASVAY